LFVWNIKKGVNEELDIVLAKLQEKIIGLSKNKEFKVQFRKDYILVAYPALSQRRF